MIGFVAVSEAFGLRIEVESAARSEGDLAEMNQSAASMSDLGGRLRRCAVPDGVEELGHVLGVAALAAQLFAFGRAGRSLRALKDAKRAAAREDHVALGPVEDVAVVEPVQAVSCEWIVLVDQQPAVRVLVGHVHVVGILAGVTVEQHASAAGADLLRQRCDAKPPRGHVEIVNAVVADLAVAVVAEHPPCLMPPMRIERPLRSWAEPAVVIRSARRRAVGLRLLDRASLRRPCASHLDLADDSVLEQLSGFLRHGTASHLTALLHNSAVFLRGGDDQRPFVEDVRDWLFDVAVLSRRHRRQRDRRVPMMRRRDDHGIDVLVLNDLFVPSRPLRRRGLKVARHQLVHPLDLSRIDIAEPRDRGRLATAHQTLHVMRHDPAAADDAQPNLRRLVIAERMHSAERGGRAQNHRGLRCLLEEFTTAG